MAETKEKSCCAACAAARPKLDLDGAASADKAATAAAVAKAAFRRQMLAFAGAALLWGIGLVLDLAVRTPWSHWSALAAFLASYALAGTPVLVSAAKNLLRGHALDENFLMSLATVGAFAVGAWEEAAGVMLFYMIGELAQESAVHRARRSIDALAALKPDSARVRDGEAWKDVRAEAVPVGSLVLVRPGERIPLDGVVEEGEAFVDSSMLTGESLPRRAGPGDAVRSGTVAADGVLKVRTTRVAGESAAARIVQLVEGASRAKAKTERFIAVFARWYTPAVVVLALLVAFLPPFFMEGQSFSDWLYRALIMLVISCPCALVVSIPLGYFGGIGGLSRRGILVKGAVYIDALAKADRVAFDKTGTLTEGSFELRAVQAAPGISEDEVLSLAAAAESHSNHPLAKALRAAAAERGLAPKEAGETRETAGQGVRALVDGAVVLAGNAKLLSAAGVALPVLAEDGLSGVLVARDGAYLGRLAVGDRAKGGAAEAVAALDRLGFRKLSLVSGDAAGSVERTARELGIADARGGLAPEEKLALAEAWSAAGERVVFVGDGINDAPVLARCSVGVAMGSGADAAVEAADVVIMTDDPRRVPEAIARARRTRRIVYQNIVFALGVKAFFLTLGALGEATMWEAVIADVGVALAAVLNASRALR